MIATETFSRNAYQTEIDQYQLDGSYDFDCRSLRVLTSVCRPPQQGASPLRTPSGDTWARRNRQAILPTIFSAGWDLAGKNFDSSVLGQTQQDFGPSTLDQLICTLDTAALASVCGGERRLSIRRISLLAAGLKKRALQHSFQSINEYRYRSDAVSLSAGLRYEND